MRLGTGRALRLLAAIGLTAVISPAAASAALPGASASVQGVHARQAGAASMLNVLTLNDERGVANRISAYIAPNGRLTLTAPEGLSDPDGGGSNCGLDNASPGQSSAAQVSCAPGYIGAIVGDLGGRADSFDADPALPIPIGAVIDGVRRPLAGGSGRDKLVGGAARDLLVGGGGGDSVFGGGGRDVLIGGAGPDSLSGGGGPDLLIGLGGPDRLNGGGGRDLCRGGGGADTAKRCEAARGIP